jgi:hypothetical protein
MVKFKKKKPKVKKDKDIEQVVKEMSDENDTK